MKGVRRKDFLFANDSWFRGICVKTGPDGGLYVSDWCDTGECHNYDKADTTNGRIYRVVYKGAKHWTGDVSKMTDAELVKLQLHPNDWFVRKARRVLQERAAAGTLAKETPDALRKLLKDETDVPKRLRVLWALEAMQQLPTTDLQPLLKSSSEVTRVWAFRSLLNANRELSSREESSLSEAMHEEKSPYVRLHIAGALQNRAGKHKQSFMHSLLWWQESDPQVLLMMWYALLQCERADPGILGQTVGYDAPPLIIRYSIRYSVERAGADLPEQLEKSMPFLQEFKLSEPKVAPVYLNILQRLPRSAHGAKGTDSSTLVAEDIRQIQERSRTGTAPRS